VRLISNANHKPSVLLALAPTHGALENLEALESVTNRRQEAQQKGVPGIAPGALATGYGYSSGEVRTQGCNGIVYPSVRHRGGECLAVFWPGLIQNFQQGATWILTWAGSPTPTITRA
jgi:hypothetical protein